MSNDAAAPVVDPQLSLQHSMELLLIPLSQATQGCLPDFLRTSRPTPDTRNLVVFILTWSHVLFMPAFHVLSLWGGHDEPQVISVKDLPWHTSAELVRKRMKSSGRYTHSHAKLPSVLSIACTRLRTLGYMLLIKRTAHPSTPRLLKAHHRAFLGTRSKANSSGLLVVMYFSCRWQTMKMVSVAHSNGTN